MSANNGEPALEPEEAFRRAVYVVSGIPGSGKTTVANALARRFPRGVHVEADALQRCIVRGGVWPDGEPHEEAMRQLRLRGLHVALLADSFFRAGFTPVVDDVVIGARLRELLEDLKARPVMFVLLVPRLDVIRGRDAMRPNKSVFHKWGHLAEVAISETPRVGLWLDTSDLDVAATVDEILRRSGSEALVPGTLPQRVAGGPPGSLGS